MERTTVVLTGRVGSDISMHVDKSGNTPFARFRMVTPRGRWKDDGVWEELEGAWYTVKVWGNLAHNVHYSLRKGHPVIVVGRPASQAWINKENQIVSEIAIHASTVGHDLNRGVATYARISVDSEPAAPPTVTNRDEDEKAGLDEAGEESPTPTNPVSDDYEVEKVPLASGV